MLKRLMMPLLMTSVLLVAGCALPVAINTSPHVSGALTEEAFISEYAGIYILNPDIRTFIKNNEADRERLSNYLAQKRQTLTKAEWQQLRTQLNPYVLFPRRLPNGCHYDWDQTREAIYFCGSPIAEGSPEAQIIKAHIGEANWQKYRDGIRTTAHINCYDNVLGFVVVIGVSCKNVTFGLKTDAGRGFSLWHVEPQHRHTHKVYEYRDGQFVESALE